jgi:hypothetical protein
MQKLILRRYGPVSIDGAYLMREFSNVKKETKAFRSFSALFWLSVPVVSFLWPLILGHGWKRAAGHFLSFNSGPMLVILVTGAGPSVPESLVCSVAASAILFLILLGYLCFRGIGAKAWIFLTLWYAIGSFFREGLIAAMSA